MSKRSCGHGVALQPQHNTLLQIMSTLFMILLSQPTGGYARKNLTDLTFRVGASVGRDGPCAQLYEQTARGYQYVFDWLARQPPLPPVVDTAGRNYSIRLQFRLVTHDCTDAGRAVAMGALITGTPLPPGPPNTTTSATDDAPGPFGPMHLLLGGNGINAQEDALQANAASRLLLHCCTARDSVYLMDLPYVYGLFTPASMYTGTILRTMAFSGLRRVAVAYTTDSALHRQLCSGALRQMVPLGELRPGFKPVVTLNYTDEASAQPGFWDEAAAAIAGGKADALVACDEIQQSSKLVQALRRSGHWLSAKWLASYGNVSDVLSYLGDAGEYALTTVQWMPSLQYADPVFGTAAEYGRSFTASTGLEASYISAAASASGYVLLTALRRAVSICDLSALREGTADAFMWQAGALVCGGSGGNLGVGYSNVSGQLMLRNVLNTLQMDTFFGPVGFNHYRQNVYHPPVVAQILDNRLAVVVPLDMAEQRLVLPIPLPTEPGRGPSWAATKGGIIVITLICCLGCLCLVLTMFMLRRWLPRRLSLELEVEVEIEHSEVEVDVAPVRNVDGSFELGEGVYRGTRVKLVVATELMAAAAPSPPPPPAPPPVVSVPPPPPPLGTFLSLGLPGNKTPPPAPSPLGPMAAANPQRTNTGSQLQPWNSTGLPCDNKLDSAPTLRVKRDAATLVATGGRRQLESPPLEPSPPPPSTPTRDQPLRVPSGLQSAAPGWLSRRNRKLLSGRVWRAMRLQHPSICPVLGIIWEWPGLLEGGGTVPVVVRQWYELGDLAQLIENETVPLPLLTKTGIVQGIAEGLAYLHAQEPPITAGPLEMSRVIIDKNFNPHIFLRLVNLDPAYSTMSASAAAAAAPNSTRSAGGNRVSGPYPVGVRRGMVSSGGDTNSPCRTPRALRAPLPVVLVDALSYEHYSASQEARPSCELEPSSGSRPAADPWVSGAAPSERSKAQDVLEFGRLLGAVFLGVSGTARLSEVPASGSKPLDAGAQQEEAFARMTVNNNNTRVGTGTGRPASTDIGMAVGMGTTSTGMAVGTGTGTGMGMAACVATGLGGTNSLRKQSTCGSELAPSIIELVRQSSSMGEQQLQQQQLSRQASLRYMSCLPLGPPQALTQQQQELMLQRKQQQQELDTMMLHALDIICPEVAGLARACMHSDPLARPSFSAVVAVLESSVRLALSSGLGLTGISRACMGLGGRLSMEARQSRGGGTDGTAGAEAPEDGGFGRGLALAAARITARAAVPGARRSCSFQLGPTGQPLEKNAMRRHLIAPDDLLFDLFPPKVAHALCAGEAVQPERYDCVSIFFSDVVGYTDLCCQLQPYEVMDLMHRLYSQFDDLIRELRLFKVETVGDAYLAVGNLRWPQPETHARLIAQFAFAAVRAAAALVVHPDRPELGNVRIRVGLHCGPVVGSVVGTLNRRYCLFGDAVNTAARMEHNSEADRVHCSGAFAALVSEQSGALRLVSRGVRQIKGKGPMETFWVEEQSEHGPFGAGSGTDS